MKVYNILISGKWGHFRRPEANNNPITYDFIPKTAFIGLMSAVVGLNRAELKQHYEKFSKEIFYSVQILSPIKKIATNFRIYKYKGGLTNVENPPQFYEILKDPSFRITFFGENELVEKFIVKVKNFESTYQPTLGLANCPAIIKFENEIELSQTRNTQMKTNGIIPKNECNIKFDFKSGEEVEYMFSYDNIPVVQNEDWHNIEYKEVFYGYLPKGSYITVEPSDYKKQYIDESGIGYFFV